MKELFPGATPPARGELARPCAVLPPVTSSRPSDPTFVGCLRDRFTRYLRRPSASGRTLRCFLLLTRAFSPPFAGAPPCGRTPSVGSALLPSFDPRLRWSALSLVYLRCKGAQLVRCYAFLSSWLLPSLEPNDLCPLTPLDTLSATLRPWSVVWAVSLSTVQLSPHRPTASSFRHSPS